MRTWEQFLIERFKETHEYSSVMIDLPKNIADKIIKWGHEHIDNDDLYVKGRDYGREDHIHCTVLYGLETHNSNDVKKILKDKEIVYHLGQVTMFTTHQDYNVVKITVSSPQIIELNKKLNTLPHAQSMHNRFSPHVTIAYVKKGGKYSGHFTDTIRTNEVVFSSKDGKKTKIKLPATI